MFNFSLRTCYTMNGIFTYFHTQFPFLLSMCVTSYNSIFCYFYDLLSIFSLLCRLSYVGMAIGFFTNFLVQR